MKTIEYDIKRDEKISIISSRIKKSKIEFGKERFKLHFFSYDITAPEVYAGLLLVLAYLFILEKNKNVRARKINIALYGSKIQEYITEYLKKNDVNSLEKKIEKDFNIAIEFDYVKSTGPTFVSTNKQNPVLNNLRFPGW